MKNHLSMNQSIDISGSRYTVLGTVKNRTDEQGILGLTVLVYDKDRIGKDDFLDSTTTDASGVFRATFDVSGFRELFLDRKPDLYFVVKDHTTVLLDTRDNPIKNADASEPPILLWVDDFDSNAPGAGKVPALGWKGGFLEDHPEFAYPNPNLSSLGPLKDNMANIDKLQRQQKVLWPEFSWETLLGDPTSRCYQMFAPDISRLGYTDEGRVYSIICPQQGACFSSIGCMNVEVTVTGNRGWVDETNKTLYADMSVVGKIWFSPSAHQNKIIKGIWDHFAENDLPFPFSKEHAIVVETFCPGKRPEVVFPLTKGQTTEFPIPDFAKHPEAWDVAHLGVEIGPVRKLDIEKVDRFNQMIMDVFNAGSGNMLKDGNVLTWNVWFIAPQLVDTTEWQNHADKWRASIDADHGSPLGPGTDPRYFNGDPFKPLKSLAEELEEKVIAFAEELG